MNPLTALANKGIEIIEEALDNVLPENTQDKMKREYAARQEAEQRQRDERDAQKKAEAERILAYLAQPRRTVDEIQADITAHQAEQTTLGQELASIEAELIAGDLEPSIKTAQREALIQHQLKAISGRMMRLADELADAQRAELLAQAQESISGYLERAEALLAYERDEFTDLEKRYLAAMEHRRQERYWLYQWQADAGLLQIKQQDRTLQPDIEALKAPHPLCHTIWKMV